MTKKRAAKLKDKKALDFAAQAEEALMMESNRTAKFIIYLCFIIIVVFFVWAALVKVETITVAEGKVVSASKIQNVESLDGGIISNVYVKKNQKVVKGQALVQFEEVRFAADLQKEKNHIQALQASIIRLRAQANLSDTVSFPAEMKKQNPLLVQRERSLFKQRMSALNAELAVLKEGYRLAKEEIGILQPLVKEQIVSVIELLQLKREANSLRGEITKTTDSFKNEALSELSDLNHEYQTSVEALKSLQDKHEKAVVRAPISGVINQVLEHNVGAVIRPGDPVVEISPSDEKLLIDAKVPPHERAFIEPGQQVNVKITAYDYTTYGSLTGRVVHISPDTIADKVNGHEQQFFHVTVETNDSFIQSGKQTLPITPGMTATVDIVTGYQTVLNYLLKPILRAKSSALREA